MARFVRFKGCEKCGSRDNVGVYDDGSSWCFGCHAYSPASSMAFVPTRDVREENGSDGEVLRGLLGRESLPERVVRYLNEYQLTVEDILHSGGGWNPSRSLLTFPYYDKEGTLVCVQGRNFGDRGPKYFNRGSTYQVVDLIGKHSPTSVVITEDKLSAIKVSKVTNAFPALGTQVQLHKLVWLKAQGVQNLYLWLDRDKWKEGVEICDKAKWLGLSTRAIYSELDPKSYSLEQIMVYLSMRETP